MEKSMCHQDGYENPGELSHDRNDGTRADATSNSAISPQSMSEVLASSRYGNTSEARPRKGAKIMSPFSQDPKYPVTHIENADHGAANNTIPTREPGTILYRLTRTVDQLNQYGDTIILKRYELEHQQQTLDQCQKYLLQSVEDMQHEVDATLTATALDDWRTKVRDRHSEVQKDYQAAMSQSGQVAATRKQISDLESLLKNKTTKLNKYFRLQTVTEALSKLDALDSSLNDLSSKSSSVRSSAQSETPPLLARYYDRKGDIGIFRERLQELEYLYQEEIDERDLVHERGDVLDISDEQFRENYRLQRQAISFDLEEAERDAQALAKQCHAEGIDILERKPDSSEEEASSPLLALKELTNHRPGSRSTTSSNCLSPRGQIRVRGWLDTLSDPGTPALGALDSAKVDAAEKSLERAASLELDAANAAPSPMTSTTSFLRRAASFPQSSKRAVDTIYQPSSGRTRAPVGNVQQQEVTDFELVPNRNERDTTSLPEGDALADRGTPKPGLRRFFSFFKW